MLFDNLEDPFIRILRIKNTAFNAGDRSSFIVWNIQEKPYYNDVTKFALCQICRLRNNGIVVDDPSTTLSWLGDNSKIKKDTLLPSGWFIDHLYRGNGQFPFFFMDSYNEEVQNIYIKQCVLTDETTLEFKSYGPLDNLVVHNRIEALDELRKKTRAICKKFKFFPLLTDHPQVEEPLSLEFQVHLVFLHERPNNFPPTMSIGQGFSWQHKKEEKTLRSPKFIRQNSEEFFACLQKLVEADYSFIESKKVLLIRNPG